MDFGWFAIDSQGNFALFVTAGSGPIPKRVLAVVEAHADLDSALDITGWGTEAVWRSYSNAGIFAYDWSAQQGSYIRVAEPTSAPSQELEAWLQSAGLPRLELRFSLVASIQESCLDSI